MTRRPGLLIALVCLLVPAAAFAALKEGGDSGPPRTPRGAASAFLDHYVDGDGRVVRHDQGGDTVSEGQAYAMLLTAAIGDKQRFRRVWGWTHTHLQRPDGLLAWHWADGRVADGQAATDADLDAARALLVAARTFGEPGYRNAALRIGHGVLAHETVKTPAGRVLLAGPWARHDGVFNPSYVSPRAFRALGAATGDGRWGQVAEDSRRLADRLTQTGLPPDWARLSGASATATGSPRGGGKGAYGYDAIRLPVRLAESCSPADRALAAGLWPALRTDARLPHAAALTGAAGAAAAAGDRASRDRLLDQAADLDHQHPTYYGSAWVALGRVMLTTHALGRCG
jgi:endoglucanase